MSLTAEQRERLQDLKFEMVAEAPTDSDEGEYRLVESGFRSKEEAEQRMFFYAQMLWQKYGNTDRFGVRVMPMFQPVPGRRRISGWGVFIRDRAHSAPMRASG